MKIAVLVFGAIDYSVAFSKALSKYCDVQFYCSKYLIEKKDSSILDVLGSTANMCIYDDYRIRDFRNIFIYYKLSKEIWDSCFDIIHFQTGAYPWFLMHRKLWRRIPLIFTVHDPYQHPDLPFITSVYEDIMQRICVMYSKKIILHGEILKKQFLERYPKKRTEDVVVLPHGDFSIYKYWTKKSVVSTHGATKDVLFFGNITPYKGLEYLLKAEQLMRDKTSNYRIVVAGKGITSTHRRYISNLSKFKLVDEFILNEDIPKYFENASLVVLPYTSATQSGIIPIAYAFGKPVVATNVGAIPEVVENGKTGLLVEPRDERALADAIIDLLSDETLLKNMGENALNFAKRNLSWDSIAKKTMEIYRDVI